MRIHQTFGRRRIHPLCADVEAPHWHCWNPVEVADQEACHFFGHVSFYDHAPPMTWSGACRNGKSEGDGVLSDDMGNRAEGRLVEGLKEARWTATLASGSVIAESHAGGVFHGPWMLRSLQRKVLRPDL
ncbi:MAG: hypothetical protein OXD40_15570 [bacterium]|nr:hypothetical protein [bacterium]